MLNILREERKKEKYLINLVTAYKIFVSRSLYLLLFLTFSKDMPIMGTFLIGAYFRVWQSSLAKQSLHLVNKKQQFSN